jgi:hypothetical protein
VGPDKERQAWAQSNQQNFSVPNIFYKSQKILGPPFSGMPEDFLASLANFMSVNVPQKCST